MSEKYIAHHLKCTEDDIGKYVILPGDPDRVPIIADYLEDAHQIIRTREFNTYTGCLNGHKVSVVSTGIGCPSAAIAMEELIKLGAHTFLRLGTCGCMSPIPKAGDCIIATGSIRRDGASIQYLPIEFPAVADFEVVNCLVNGATSSNQTYHLGIVETKDSYYGQHEPTASPVSYELLNKWDAFSKGGAIGSEMESSVLFILGSVHKVRVGSLLHVARNRVYEDLSGSEPITDFDTTPTIKTGIKAMQLLIDSDKSKLK